MHSFKMDREQAIFIRHLRRIEDFSWRKVHKEWQKRFVKRSEWWINESLHAKGVPGPHGNQITGMKLCVFAQNLLKEEW